MREVPCFICFDMATPARVVWVIVRLYLIFFAAVTWLTFHPFPLERPAQSSIAMPATPQLDHVMLGDKPQALARHPRREGLGRQPELGSL